MAVKSVNDQLLDKYIRHAVYMEQLKAGEAAAISTMLRKEVFPQLHDKLISELSKVQNLGTVGNIRKVNRIKQMMSSIETTATAGAIKAGNLINKNLYNVAKFEARWNKLVIEKTVPLDINFNIPSNEVLKTMATGLVFEGHKMQTWMKGYSKSIQAGVFKQLRVGVSSGESIPALSQRLKKVLGSKANQATTLARTATSQIVHNTREATFKMNKELIRKVQWVATLDDRTTLVCINYDGRLFDVGEGERPPAHFQCRSTIVPVTPSWQEFGVVDPPAATRASMNGAVAAKTNYRTWIKSQSIATQNKVLGKTRADLYRSGKVTIDRFVGKDLKPLSLNQLARREGLTKAEVTLVRPPKISTISNVKEALVLSDKATAKVYKPIDDGLKTYNKALRLTSPEAKLMLNRIGKTKEQVYKDIIKNREMSIQAGSTKVKYFGPDVKPAVNLKREKLHDVIIRKILGNIESTDKPKALMTGGLPGAGKSDVLNKTIPGWKNTYVHVDSDSIKLMLAKADGLSTLGPNAAAYHEEADLILGRVLAKAIKEKKSILYDGTMRNAGRMDRLMSEFNRAGYNTTAIYADLPLEKSMIRSVGRAYGPTGRFVDPMMQTTHGTKNIETFNMLKEKVNDWKHYDTDVVFGEKPILIESK